MTAGGAALAGAVSTAALLAALARRASATGLLAIAALGAFSTAAYIAAVAGPGAAGTFALVYLLEAALTLDTAIALLMLFGYFAVPATARLRLLRWAIGGTIALRIAAVPLGHAALDKADWLTYPLAVLLLATTIVLIRTGPRNTDARAPRPNRTLAMAARLVPLTDRYHEDQIRTDTSTGRRWTPMVVVAVAALAMAFVLAVDGIAAGAAFTDDTALVVAATILAVSALGAVHQVVATRLAPLVHLKAGLSVLLLFAGLRLLATGPEPPQLWPTVGAALVALSVAAIARPHRTDEPAAASLPAPTTRSTIP